MARRLATSTDSTSGTCIDGMLRRVGGPLVRTRHGYRLRSRLTFRSGRFGQCCGITVCGRLAGLQGGFPQLRAEAFSKSQRQSALARPVWAASPAPPGYEPGRSTSRDRAPKVICSRRHVAAKRLSGLGVDQGLFDVSGLGRLSSAALRQIRIKFIGKRCATLDNFPPPEEFTSRGVAP